MHYGLMHILLANFFKPKFKPNYNITVQFELYKNIIIYRNFIINIFCTFLIKKMLKKIITFDS